MSPMRRWRVRLAGGVALGVAMAAASGAPMYAQSSTPEREAVARRHLQIGAAARQGVVEIEWLDDGSSFRFRSGDAVEWRVYDPGIGQISGTTRTEAPESPSVRADPPREVGRGDFGYPMFEMPSPDGTWYAHRRDGDLWLRRTGSEELVRLTDDGAEDAYYGEAFEWGGNYSRPWAWWSPDGSRLALKKRDERQVPVVTRMRYGEAGIEAQAIRHSLVGEPLRKIEVFLFDVAARTGIRVEDGDDAERYVLSLGWSPDGSEFWYVTLDRTHRHLRLLAADAVTGAARVILEDRRGRDTFHSPLWSQPPAFVPLSDGRSFLWVSDRDGYRHLYRYAMDGTDEAKLTRGSVPIQDVVRVDEADGWVYLTGRPDPARPYDLHLLRARLDGSGVEPLTEGSGTHQTRLSPSGDIFVDTWSSPDRLPVTVVRRRDGSVLDTLARAGPADLEATLGTPWVPPEEVVVTGSDGTTELHGLLYKPFDFDPSRSYPIIEYIYDGANTTVVVRSFPGVTSGNPEDGYPWDSLDPLALAQLGYLVWVVDGRGTEHRGRAFRDAAVDQDFDFVEEHVGALRQVAEQRPYVDLDRVGVFGLSAGGGKTVTSMLRAPEVYRVGMAMAVPGDGRWWPADLEFLRGPVDENPEAYEDILDSASRLEGDLLIIQGTADPVVPMLQLFRLIEALVAAGKPYDLLLLPGEGHTAGPASASYAREAVWRYFLEHLPPGS